MCKVVSKSPSIQNQEIFLKRHLKRRDAHIHRPRDIQRKRLGETNMWPTESCWDHSMQGVQAHLMLRHSAHPMFFFLYYLLRNNNLVDPKHRKKYTTCVFMNMHDTYILKIS